ncbi:MAG: hypothetical protein E6G97_07530 [Alphaproteobacteria bacterium]|nr:MAG: hypothetical protein E6G97_07530 [Alphaproteobacteria bacterium]
MAATSAAMTLNWFSHYRFFFRSRTPGASSLVNSTPAASRKRPHRRQIVARRRLFVSLNSTEPGMHSVFHAYG